MRRGLLLGSAGLSVVGLELATRSVSLTLGRLQSGFSALFAGVEFQVGAFRFLVGVTALMAGLVLALLAVWSVRLWSMVQTVGKACPECGERTKRVKRKRWQRLASRLMGERLNRRSCERCGWTGLTLSS